MSANKLGAFISVSENMAGAFTGVVGALQLMGIESSSAEASIAKLMQLQSIVQGLQSINQFRKQWTALIASVKAGKVATDTINTITTATNEGAEASKNLAGGMEGTATATKSATTATKVFGTAFKAVGIGLLVAGIGYLIANFDKLKEIVFNLIPGLKGVADFVGKLVEKVTDFVGITSKAGRELEKLKRLNADITSGIDDQIEILSALGNKEKEVYELQLKRIRLKRNELEATAKVNKKYTDEELKQLKELNTQQNVLIITEKNRLNEVAKEKADKRKEEADKAKADYQQQLTQLKGYLKEAEKVTYASNNNARKVELKNLNDKYKEQIDLAKKLHHDISKLEISQKIERDLINRKYDDEYFNYIKNNQSQFLDSFSKEYLESIKSFNEQKKNATNEQKADLDIRLNNQLIYLSKIQQLALSTRETEKDLLKSEASNEGNEKDSFKIKKAQLEAIYTAQKEHDEIMLQNAIDANNLENSELERIYQEGQARMKELMQNPEINANDISVLQAELNARLSAIDTNNRAIEDVTFQHNLNLQKNEKAHGLAKKKLLAEEKNVKLSNLSVIADATSKATELLGESTVAGKAMGIATATIDTYVAGAKAMKEVPYPFNFVALATTIASGLATVKKIISVKIPNTTDTSSATAGGGAGATYQAPVINSTILKSSENGTDSLATTIAEKQDNQVIKAYITNSDLESNQQKNDFINQISRF